jgi:RNA-directed DNA polymerase
MFVRTKPTDVEKCFDQISHDYLMKHTPICDKHVLQEWLKARVHGRNRNPERGTPQGGVRSPYCAIFCSFALNGIEGVVKRAAGTTDRVPKVHLVIYADDLVGTAGKRPGFCRKPYSQRSNSS